MAEFRTRIITVLKPGGPDALTVEERVLEGPADDEVLIKVAGAGINRPDIFERMGFYPPPPGAPEGLGLEVSGEILAKGAKAEFNIGDPVVALVSGGGYADIARAKIGSVLRAPDGVDLVHAAGLPETVFTVWVNAFERSALKPGEHFLVHGGASGIGSTAIQMAKAHGAIVMTTAGSPEKCELCRQWGADHVFNYNLDDWEAGIKDAGGADVILDMVAGEYVAKNLSVLNVDGRMSIIAFLKGSRIEADLMMLMLKRQTITGSTLRSRSDEDKAAFAQAVERTVWPWVESGTVKPVIDSIYDLDDAAKAHARMDQMAHAGKILLRP
jgi:putative PIG3 family NAD(P)H quinone oxidoreductase